VAENRFKTELTRKLRRMFPGCIILRNDANYLQGVPDILILYNDRWATLEAKAYKGARTQPNQPEYVDEMNKMSFSAFIYPENEEEVLCGLQRALEPRRRTRISQR
jgi:hypothetical protein